MQISRDKTESQIRVLLLDLGNWNIFCTTCGTIFYPVWWTFVLVQAEISPGNPEGLREDREGERERARDLTLKSVSVAALPPAWTDGRTAADCCLAAWLRGRLPSLPRSLPRSLCRAELKVFNTRSFKDRGSRRCGGGRRRRRRAEQQPGLSRPGGYTHCVTAGTWPPPEG